MLKVKLIDFLEFVNFRNYIDEDNYDTQTIRIYYPDKDNMEFNNLYKKDRYFEFGVYDFSDDTRKRIIQTLNPFVLNCYVSSVGITKSMILEIIVTEEDEIDSLNMDSFSYDLEGYVNAPSTLQKIYVCSPLSGDIKDNIKKAEKYCRDIVIVDNAIPVAPHIYFTRFLDDNVELERELGMDLGLQLLSDCGKMYVYNQNGISKGMQKEIEMAKRLNIPIVYREDEYEL